MLRGMGEGGGRGERGVPIPFPSPVFSKIPLRSAQIPFLFLIFDIILPFPVTKLRPSGLNPTFPGKNRPIPIPTLPLQDLLKSTIVREREVTPPTIHKVVNIVKLHWHLGILNSILRLRLYNLSLLSL